MLRQTSAHSERLQGAQICDSCYARGPHKISNFSKSVTVAKDWRSHHHWPSAVDSRGLQAMPCWRSRWISLRPASPRVVVAMEDATHTSRAAPRSGTAAVVKMSAGVDVASVSPRGSDVTAASTSLKGPGCALTKAQCPLVASEVLQVSSCSSGAKTLPAHKSRWQIHLCETCGSHKSSILAT